MFWEMAARPFAAFAFFAVAYLVARALSRLIPDGRIKQVLFDRGLQKRHPWKFGLGMLIAGWTVLGVGFYLYH